MFGLGKKKMKPREIREKYGNLWTTNVTPLELQQGAERQYRRYNCRVFQNQEFTETINRIFKDGERVEVSPDITCECDYCTGKQDNLL